eukprot:scaffold4304_cov58-Phaeocystis_antarctica.AAC.9
MAAGCALHVCDHVLRVGRAAHFICVNASCLGRALKASGSKKRGSMGATLPSLSSSSHPSSRPCISKWRQLLLCSLKDSTVHLGERVRHPHVGAPQRARLGLGAWVAAVLRDAVSDPPDRELTRNVRDGFQDFDGALLIEECAEAHLPVMLLVCIRALFAIGRHPRLEVWHAQRRAVILREILKTAVTILEELLCTFSDVLGADLLEVTIPEHILPADDDGRLADFHEGGQVLGRQDTQHLQEGVVVKRREHEDGRLRGRSLG